MPKDKEKEIIKAAEYDDKWLKRMQKRHVERIEESVKNLQQGIIDQMKLLKTLKNGRLEGMKVNLKQAQGLHQAIEELFETEWNQSTLSMVDEFKRYRGQLKRSYKILDEAIRFTSIDTRMMDVLRDGAWQDFAITGSQSKERVVQAVYNDIIGGAQFSDLVSNVTGVLSGGVDGITGTALVNRGRLYARDGIMNFMREVHVKKSQDIGIKRFLYVGDIIASTRPFCKKRAGKIYTLGQINSWKYKWAGKSGPAITHCGGWNCRHSFRGIRTEWFTQEQMAGFRETALANAVGK